MIKAALCRGHAPRKAAAQEPRIQEKLHELGKPKRINVGILLNVP